MTHEHTNFPVPHDIFDAGSLAEERVDNRCIGRYEWGLAEEAE